MVNKLLVFFVLLFGFGYSATSLTQHGISWTFSADLTTGQFANGDYYVVEETPGGGVTITDISPGSTVSGGRTINGSELNPTAGPTVYQGFDSAMPVGYTASLNAARPGGSDLSAGNPLVLPAGSSLVSTISHPTAGNRPGLTYAAVLTVLAEAPAAGSFRPAYCGTDKRMWNISDLDYGVLLSLPDPGSAAGLATCEADFLRPWIEINTDANGRYMHPVYNQPDYGQDMAREVERAMLHLHLDYSDAAKETLLIRLVQYGIDIWGAAKSGGQWVSNGGHNMGRKAPLILAARALGDSEIAWYADYDNFPNFHDDLSTFYIDQDAVDLTNSETAKTHSAMSAAGTTVTVTFPAAHGITAGSTSACNIIHVSGATPSEYNGYHVVQSVPTSSTLTYTAASAPSGDATVIGSLAYMDSWHPDKRNSVAPYTSGMIGTAEWGIRHATAPSRDNAHVTAQYRTIFGSPLTGHALAVILLGAESMWNHQPFFDYIDGYAIIEGPSAANSQNRIWTWQYAMWEAYRNYDVSNPPVGAPTAPSSLSMGSADFNSLTASWTDNASDESYFEVWQSTVSGSGFTLSCVAGANETSAIITGLTPHTLYYFKVLASNAAGDSAYTSEATGTTLTRGPAPANRRPGSRIGAGLRY